MIPNKLSSLIFALLLLATFSCEEERSIQTGKLEFSVLLESNSSEGGRTRNGNISALLVTIKSPDGRIIHERKNIPLYSFGDEYISEPIALTLGSFQLTEFVVLDENNTAIYAAPLAGSPLAYLVDAPLPLDFTISKDATTKISPEVIEIEGHTSKDFGYATFGVDIIQTFTFSAGVFTYNATSKNFELTDAHVLITSGDLTLYNTSIDAATTNIRVRDGQAGYHISVTKEGYSGFSKSFTADELKAYATGSPLVITLLTTGISEGLVAYYPFNGNANDETANDFHGIVHEATLTSDRKGNVNAAYRFDGINDYIQVPHDDALNLTADFSISLWANISTSQEPENGINDILRKWLGNPEGYPFGISYLNPLAADATEDKILFARYDGQICSNVLETHSPTVTNDEFIHIGLIKHGDLIRTYLNGELIGTVTDPITCPASNTADMTIGCRGNLVRFFKGMIDDIRIYDRALTDQEIGELYQE